MPTNIVRAHVDGTRAQPFERFIQSCDFLNGFIRLVRHAWKENGDAWTTEEENRIGLYFKNIHFKHASGINAILFLTERINVEPEDTKMIENPHEIKKYNSEVSKEIVCIYFNIDDDEWLENIKAALSIHLNEAVQSRLKDDILMILREMIGVYEAPGQVEIILSRENIPSKELNMEMKEIQSTKPGTFVPRELHRYLDNDYGMFDPKEDELIALEIDDPALDVDDTLEESGGEEKDDNIELSSTYIYVKILEKIEPENGLKLLQEYKVDDGSENPCTVKAFQLFKFIAKAEKSNKEQSMEISEGSSLRDSIGILLQMAYADVEKCLAGALKQPEYIRRRIVKRLLFKWDPLKNHDRVSLCTEVYNFIQHSLLCLEKGLDLPEGPDDYRDTGADRSRDWWASWYGRYLRRHERYNQYNRDECDAVPPSSSGYSSYRTDRNKEPYHWYSECRRWQKQAISDLANSKNFIRSTPSETFNWVCYKAHQATEKSLKAAWYAKDANQIHSVKFSHDIVSIASGLGSDLVLLANSLANLVGEHTRMRYPDSFRGQLIPADAYNRQTAETAVHLARQIIDIVKRDFIR